MAEKLRTVRQVSQLTGLTPRTLQYYDKIGLLQATAHTESGYRLYDAAALERLQQILLFRELEFPLKVIRQILSRPDFDRATALQQQIDLLTLKKEHLENLISLARELQANGGNNMDFTAFDRKKMDDYAREARETWSKTEAYQEYTEKSRDRSPTAEAALGQGLMAIFAEMGRIRNQAPAGPAAQALVAKLQDYITRHYYRCTNQILLGLGQMYAAGGDFTENIDAAGGAGTAEFANAAIQSYCQSSILCPA